jgi:iron complex transport system substrate-binding protein
MSKGFNNLTSSIHHPQRIVSLSPSNTEILFAVGAGDKVVGVTDYCNYPDQLVTRIVNNKIERVGGYWNPSVATIVKLKPDLVLISTAKCSNKTNKCKTDCSRRCELTLKTANKLRSIGLNLLLLAPHSLNDVLGNILNVGHATGNSSQAIELIENLRHRIEVVASKSNKISNKPKVYFEVWNNPYMSVSSKTWIGNLINMAGGTNIFGNEISEWPIINSEDVIRKNPDIMVFPVIPGVPRFWGSFTDVSNREGWKQINAVKAGRLYEMFRDWISRPGPRLVDSLELLEKMFHKN